MLPKILLVDNYCAPQKVTPLKDSLLSSGARVTVIGREDSRAATFNEYDGVALSGSPAMLSENVTSEQFEAEIRAVQESSIPILGICFGHQLIGRAFGSMVAKASTPTKRYIETEVLVRDKFFADLPDRISVYESHSEIVQDVPEGFTLLARSPTSPIAAYRHDRLPIFGVQFHPEKNSSAKPDGAIFVSNFVKSLS